MVSQSSAHERIVAALLEVAAGEGCGSLTVERVLRAACVSRASFYQHFANIDDCLWSTYRLHADELAARVRAAATRARCPELAALDVLAQEATTRPLSARLLMGEGLAGGPTGLVERDALIARLERSVAGDRRGPATVDLPTTILIGAAFRFLVMRLEDSEAADARGELRRWAEAFVRMPSERSWSASFAAELPSPAPLPRGSPSARLRRGEARARILRATAAVVHERGYGAITVADIASRAGVSRRRFYNEFSGKAAAFIAAYEYSFESVLGACAPAFFASSSWPERIWDGAQASTAFIAREPSLSYLGLVECYAVDRDFSRRVNATQLAFTLFLEEGYRQRPQLPSPTRSFSILTAVAIAEIAFRAARACPGLHIRLMQPLAVYMILTPFIGSEDAGRFVSAKLSASAPMAT